MIENILKLLDNFIGLAERKKRIKKQILTDVLISLYDNLQVVHEDYVKLFEKCRRAIIRGDDLEQISNQLAEGRQEKEVLRERIWSMTDTYWKQPQFARYEHFFAALFTYAQVAEWPGPSSMSRRLALEFEKFLAERTHGKKRHSKMETEFRKEISDDVASSLQMLRDSWQSLCQEYAKLKLASAMM